MRTIQLPGTQEGLDDVVANVATTALGIVSGSELERQSMAITKRIVELVAERHTMNDPARKQLLLRVTNDLNSRGFLEGTS